MSKKDLEISTLERVSKDEYSNEVKTCLATAQKDPTADNYMYLGLAFSAQGLFREATEAYSKAISIDPFKGILYRHRGHRYLSCYRFEDGLADLTIASRLIPDNWDTWYHLGLARFLTGDYKGANDAYNVCYSLSKTDDEVIALSDWQWMTAKRLGDEELAEKVLSRIHDGMAYGDNLDYYERLKMYKGQNKPEDLIPNVEKESLLGLVTRGFGVANYYNIMGETKKADEVMDRLLEEGKDDMYMAFAYLATLADRGQVQKY